LFWGKPSIGTFGPPTLLGAFLSAELKTDPHARNARDASPLAKSSEREKDSLRLSGAVPQLQHLIRNCSHRRATAEEIHLGKEDRAASVEAIEE
jgi:hypothetical protein